MKFVDDDDDDDDSAIYFSILFVFVKFPPLLFDCIYLFIAMYIAVYVFIMTVLCYLVLRPQN